MYDVVIIGGGPGGYVSAIRCAQNGLKTAIVDSRNALGGTCLNEGCIPSKALLDSSGKYFSAKHHFAEHGINVNPSFDFKVMMNRKVDIVKKLSGGIDMLMKKNKIDKITGFASFVGNNKIKVDNDGELSEIEAKNFVIATGSKPSSLPNISIDGKIVVTSTECLSLQEVPKKMIVIGGGVIGVEMASVFSRLGADVHIIEYAPNILPSFDDDVCREAEKIIVQQGIKISTSSKVMGVEVGKKDGIVKYEKDGKILEDKANIILVATGRAPFTNDLGLEKVSIATNERGFLVPDHNYKLTSNIYAIGDVIPGPMLAHKAEDEGVAVADIIAGKIGHVNYKVIPSIVYSEPEVACVGMGEKELKKDGVEYKVGKFPFAANSRARAIGQTDGFVKILACPKTDRILGCSIIGHEAGTLIHEVSNLIEFSASSEDLGMICHGHPTMNEAIKEAALAVHKMAIHI